jgi:hypothetical protein
VKIKIAEKEEKTRMGLDLEKSIEEEAVVVRMRKTTTVSSR